MLNELNKIAADMLGMQGFPMSAFSRPEANAEVPGATVTAVDSPTASGLAEPGPSAQAAHPGVRIAA